MTAFDEGRCRAELAENFHDVPGFDDAFIAGCLRLCESHNLTGEDLFFKWEASTLGMGRVITERTVANVTAIVQTELAKARKQQMQQQTRFNGASRGRPGIDPFFGRRHAAQIGPTSSLLSANQLLQSTSSGSVSSIARHKVLLGLDVEGRKDEYKYMYEKVTDRSEVLDERIDEFGVLIKKYYKISDLGDPSLSTDDEVVIVGRIVLDPESSSSNAAKLNEASVCLESSRMMGSGVRIPVKFEHDLKIRGGLRGQGGIGLFPGAMVAFKGKNGGAGWFSVSEILSLPPLSLADRSAYNSLKVEHRDDLSFSMIVACGPYTSESSLDFKPWKDLLDKVKMDRPDVLLLLGPFLDCLHPVFKTGEVNDFPDDIFRRAFSQELTDLVAAVSPPPLVLLVPSVRDVQSEHAVYPQRPLRKDLVNSPSIKMLSNPARFSINGVTFAATSVDVLFHLKKEEFIKRAGEVDTIPVAETSSSTDVMSNLCRHLTYQRSFYPLFPTPLDLAQETNLDISHSNALDLCTGAEATVPDILIVPSRLKQFAKNVDDTMAINPSHASKGTFAAVFYEGEGPGPAARRLKVAIEKL
ncbi:DNA polymerase alpha/epsilon subunit B-domain-containing protein [Vararia minispora EC-137]|uniref:DNA polymerase alpha/epsilon subunit B-domain-containing protein n=1 Tax=Vararia minispora EC-137 TaxID=1314806 RepID=A0ACB8QX87_9AGAM|nr:DNA polymerase alpha/epsilon subunit B-domain-containing protein [Vararia minispora EC-137]